MNRRHFLQNIAASSFLLPNTSWANFVAEPKTDIIVIGAGISGLYTAMMLEERGFSVRILEGNNRIGGRMFTLKDLPGKPNTGGTEAADGYKRLIALSKKVGINVVDSPNEGRPQQLYCIGNQVITDTNWSKSEFNSLAENERKYAPALLETMLMQGKNKLETLDDWYSPKFAEYDIPFSEFLSNHGASPEALRLINANANTNDISTTSALNIMKSLTFRIKGGSTKAMRIEGGSQSLPEAVAKNIKTNVELRKIVSTIKDKGNKVIVNCKDGSNYEAGKVVISVPFSVLRKIKIKGKISAILGEAIQKLPYTQITQAHIGIKSEFWKDDKLPANMWTDGPIGRFFINNQTGICWMNGQEAINADKLSEDDLAKMVLSELKKYRPASEGKIEVLKLNSWGNNPFAAGSYYHLGVGMASKFYPEILKPAGNLYFCGEHTALQNNGMEAACESAERVVNQLIKN